MIRCLTVVACLLSACTPSTSGTDQSSSPKASKAAFPLQSVAGKWAIGGHDVAYLVELKVVSGRLMAKALRFDAALGEGGKRASPTEFAEGRSRKHSGSKVFDDLRLDPTTGALSGDLGPGRFTRKGGALVLTLERGKWPAFFKDAGDTTLRKYTRGSFVF